VADQAKASGDAASFGDALAKAITLYAGDLLPGCYDDWLVPEREQLRQDYLNALERIIEMLQQQRDYRLAISYGQRLLREDPLSEEAYQHLMRLHALNGDRARALRIYHNCVTTLQRELGVEPSPATRQAYEQLIKMAGPHPPQAASPPRLLVTSPLVGRQAEWQTVQSCWQQAASGQAHFVAVAGEAGIGKTRLIEELVDWVARRGTITAQARSYASEGELAYAPVTAWLRTAALRRELVQLDAVWLGQTVRLLPELLAERPDLSPSEPLTESWQRQHFFEALARSILMVNRPLLLVIDDLQWTDHETLAWLHYLLCYNPQAPLLVAGTIRSTDVDSHHPLTALLLSLRSTDQLTEIELGLLDERDTAELAAHIAGLELNSDSAAQLYQETEGHPLFVVETMRAGSTKAVPGRATSLPPKVQAVIESRLAQLSASARRIANLAATIGRAFAFDVLAEASQEDEDALVRGLDELWQRRIIREQSENDYDFSHDKIREAVYNSLSTANRRLLHRRVAGALETVHATNLDAVSAQIAGQYGGAGLQGQAIAYYQRAGEVAQQIYANQDAIQLYSKGLALLKTGPDTPGRAEQELALQIPLSIAHRITNGYGAAEVGQALSRARILCQQMGQSEQLGPVLWGLFGFNFVRSNLHETLNLGEELLAIAQKLQNSAIGQQAHHVLGCTLCSMGEFEQSRLHLEQGIALHDAEQHHAQVTLFGVDLGIFCQAWSTHTLWHLGYLEQSLQRSRETLALTQALGHPYSQALAMAYAAMLFQFSRDSSLVQEWAEAAIELCEEQDIAYYDSWATILRGWALAEQGLLTEGLDQMRQGLADFRRTDTEARMPYYLTLLAEAYGHAGQIQEGLQVLSEALDLAERNSDYWYNAGTYRLMGELMLRSGEDNQGEACFQQALDISRRQQARLLELRASVSLGRLWQQQGRPEKARPMLAEILNWFSEGFDTADLKDARALLEELSS
jgi:predicted ATPase